MSQELPHIFAKLEQFLKKTPTEVSAIEFFGSLSPAEYAQLVTILKENDFPGLQEETKQKVISVLELLANARG